MLRTICYCPDIASPVQSVDMDKTEWFGIADFAKNCES